MASASSSSSSSKKYDAFLSFSGADVRYGFLSHLREALGGHGIEAFIDDQMDKGQQISKFLLEDFYQSVITIVIFSQNYAYSEWCLEELLKIVECRNSTGQTVIPVFYHVDPSHVQNLTGSYGDAMAQHRNQFDKSLVEKWGSALKATACLSGIVSSHYNTEFSLIEEIIKHTLEKLDFLLSSYSYCDDGLVGIDSRVEKVMSLLCGPEDERVVGIWGEGGIGKTTLAHATFDRIYSQFDSQYFVENVREKSEKSTADAIQNEVVYKLSGTTDFNMSKRRLKGKKVIIVLDDVSDLDQIKLILRYKDDVGPGSRIIVTSKDHHLLKCLGAKIYAVEKLDRHEAHQLFCLKAFGKKIPDEGYVQLSERVAEYAQGLPLALEVLGSNLFQRSVEEWKDELEILKVSSDQKIHSILRISYEGLSAEQKEIFLDIACFFKGRQRDEVESLLDVRGPKMGITRLVDMALISIHFGCIKMHDLIQQMGKDIVCEKMPGKRRWLWDPKDIFSVLMQETGTEAVRGITLNMSKIKNTDLSPSAFQKLRNLRYLNFYSTRSGKAQLCVPQGLEYLPEQLRYLHWDQYPSKSLPLTSSCLEKLVKLTMCDSQLKKLWDGFQNLLNLKWINLSRSTKLTEVPDLSTASNLASLVLNSCESLVEIAFVKHLSHNCGPKRLSLLDISYCKSLQRLPQYLGNLQFLTKLNGDGSGVKELPPSINNLSGLGVLSFARCKGLILRPLGHFPNLWRIDLSDCGLSQFPAGDCSMPSLIILNLCGNNFKSIPESIQHLLKLRDLILTNCKKLKYLPESLKSLPSLIDVDLAGCTSLYRNANSIDRLTAAFIEERRPEYIKWFIYPESELWEVMKYKNEHGPSFFFSFKLLEDVGSYGLLFHVCLALDNPYGYLHIKGELAGKYIRFNESECKLLPNFALSVGGDRVRHMALCQIHFRGRYFVKGWTYTARIQCQSSPYEFPRSLDFGSEGGISKCGILPSFDHEISVMA